MTAGALQVLEAAVDGDPDVFYVAVPVDASLVSALAGVPMFVSEDSPAAAIARGGLPRSVFDIGGMLLEAHVDSASGQVVGRLRVTDKIAALFRRIPDALRLIARVDGVDPERDQLVLSTRGGSLLNVRQALQEAARDNYSPGGDHHMEMTLGEALVQPSVRDYIRAIAAGEDAPLIEAPRASSPLGEEIRARGRIGDERLAELFDGSDARYLEARGLRRSPGMALVEAPVDPGPLTKPAWVERFERQGMTSEQLKTYGWDPAA